MKLNKRVKLIFTDIKVYKITKNNWLQEGIMNIFREKLIVLLNKEEIHIDKLRRQITCPITNGKKVIVIIITCRIP